jgi:ribA/ribD-fused uncharacterized protein
MTPEENLNNYRIYTKSESVIFRRTTEKWGDLSNMSSGYPLFVNGTYIRSVEALYQACRYPYLPEIQQKIISQTSPMTAKMVGKPFRDKTRKDWEKTRVVIMKWCLKIKLIQNYEKFSRILKETEHLNIVESSNKDTFWGARPTDTATFEGVNALGRLLMELRDIVNESSGLPLKIVTPPTLEDFLLFGKQIQCVEKLDVHTLNESQNSLFDV